MANASSNRSGRRPTDKVWTPKGMQLLVKIFPKEYWAKTGDDVLAKTVIQLGAKGYEKKKLDDMKIWKPRDQKHPKSYVWSTEWFCEKCGRTANGRNGFRNSHCAGYGPSCWGYSKRTLFLNRMRKELPSYPRHC